jgi:fucose permease
MTLTGNPALLLVAFTATGIGRGTMSNITNVVVSEVAENKTGGLNFLHASFAVGAFISPFIAILVTSGLGLSWKLAALIVAACEIVALVGIGLSRLASKPMARRSDGGRDFVRSGSFWLNTFIMFFYLCAEASIIGWLVTYFKDSGIMSTSLAQSTSSLLWIMVMIGRITCASVSNKVNKNKLILGLGLSMTFFFILMISTRNIMVIFPSLLGVGVSMSGIYPTTLSTMDRRFNSSTVATGTCIATATVGAILMPMVVGAVAERQGIGGGIGSISIALAVMVVLMIFKLILGKRTAKRIAD